MWFVNMNIFRVDIFFFKSVIIKCYLNVGRYRCVVFYLECLMLKCIYKLVGFYIKLLFVYVFKVCRFK